MQKDKLDLILEELYSWNPELKNKEAELINLIELMVKSKPDTKFDEAFSEALKKDLLSHRILLDNDEGLKNNNFLFNLKNMNKKIYMGVGAVAVLGLAVLAVMLNTVPMDKLALTNKSGSGFVKTNPGAFGSLARLSATNTNTTTETAASGTATPTLSAVGLSTRASAPMMGASDTISSKMIAPMNSYKYVYKGDALDLKDTTGSVYRRIKGDGNLSSNLDSLISTKSFGQINLGNFSNLQTSNISLMENKKLGLQINIDFREESIYVGQNWTQWQSERDNCGDNQACWDSYRIKISDIPEDATLIKQTNDFLTEKGINLDHYGPASVDNNWRASYEAATDKTNYYIPEEASVVYPLVVNGETVYDQNGNLDGLRVTVNLLQKAVSGVSNLTSYRYETSDYALETDSATILGLAEKGGYGSRYYFGQDQKEITLELGTPTKSLIRLWRYSNNTNDELLIPALIFPILNTSADYYGSKFITVPLAKEMVTELISNSGNLGGGIMPMVR